MLAESFGDEAIQAEIERRADFPAFAGRQVAGKETLDEVRRFKRPCP